MPAVEGGRQGGTEIDLGRGGAPRRAQHRGLAASRLRRAVELLRAVSRDSPRHSCRRARQIIVSVCQHALEPTVSGVTSSYDAATLHSRPVAIDDALKRVRGEALGVCSESLFRDAGTDGERRAAFSAMMTATTHPSAGKYGEDAISLANADGRHVVRFVRAHHDGLSFFELLQHIDMPCFSLPPFARLV